LPASTASALRDSLNFAIASLACWNCSASIIPASKFSLTSLAIPSRSPNSLAASLNPEVLTSSPNPSLT